MKKIGLGLLTAAVISASGFAANAGATASQTDVTGVVTAHQVAVANASVRVTCNGHTQTDATDTHGSYLVVFPVSQCMFGDTVIVSARKGSMSGVTSGTVRGITTRLNLAIVNVSIPEYGLLGALAAGGAGIGLIAYKRRRQGQEF
ncbi:MAG TPA: hypothetical protein VLI05_01560 [Candidatus Saccharimonadia bacterium]|nr:hypothetical protein [Candidatus Saccharimonadia bacterium]